MFSTMLNTLRHYGTLTVGLIAASALLLLALPMLITPKGTYGPAILQAESSFGAALVLLLTFLAATAVAAVVGRVLNAAVGLFVLGAALFALSYRLGTATEFAFSGELGLLPVESIGWGVLVLLASVAVFRIAGPLPDIAPDEHHHHPHPFKSVDAWKMTAAGMLMIPIVWLVARSPMGGQAIAAATLGGIAAGLAGRLISPHVQPVLLFASPVLFGAVGHVIGMVMTGEDLPEAYIKGDLSPLTRVMPIHLASGALMGVAIGLGWAKSFLHEEETTPANRPIETAPASLSHRTDDRSEEKTKRVDQAQAELDRLFDAAAKRARDLLERHSELEPIAQGLAPNGAVSVVPLPGDAKATSSEAMAEALLDALRTGAAAGTHRAVALATDCMVRPPGAEGRASAVQVRLEHITGRCVLVYLPYELHADGRVEYSATFATPAEPVVFN